MKCEAAVWLKRLQWWSNTEINQEKHTLVADMMYCFAFLFLLDILEWIFRIFSALKGLSLNREYATMCCYFFLHHFTDHFPNLMGSSHTEGILPSLFFFFF